MVSARFRRHSRRAAKSLRNKKLYPQGYKVGFHLEVLSFPLVAYVRRIHSDRQKVIQTEVDELLAVGFIREVTYLDWLANVVVVPKK
uniref:Uncharacterized protein n=1 Tax=Vitis vinifera TaxID=29760 RepID=A5BWK6_VITVI|nr:hypothetical protein VITISV_020041 [Vitis vinifera]